MVLKFQTNNFHAVIARVNSFSRRNVFSNIFPTKSHENNRSILEAIASMDEI